MTTIDELVAAHLQAEAEADQVDRQPISWNRRNWEIVWDADDLAAAEVVDSIDAEVEGNHTIRRSWIRGLADGDPMVFLAAATIWGYGNYVRRGRTALRAMLRSPDAEVTVTEIVRASRLDAAAGFNALFDSRGRTRIKSLGIAFGTKVVHFAGYGHADPGPLVLDARVFATASKLDATPPVPDPSGYTKGSEYKAYCTWAGEVARRHEVSAEFVEYVLFQTNGRL